MGRAEETYFEGMDIWEKCFGLGVMGILHN
jgi:hypothetical protein